MVVWCRWCPDSNEARVIGWTHSTIMYYPVCRGASPWSSTVVGLILLGAKEGIAVPTLCERVTKDVPTDRPRVITYPNAHHGFDMRGSPMDAPSGAPSYNADAASASWNEAWVVPHLASPTCHGDRYITVRIDGEVAVSGLWLSAMNTDAAIPWCAPTSSLVHDLALLIIACVRLGWRGRRLIRYTHGEP